MESCSFGVQYTIALWLKADGHCHLAYIVDEGEAQPKEFVFV
jgi:hypothetical protein